LNWIQEQGLWLVRRGLRGIGLEIVKSPTVIDFLQFHRVDLVLDVGANIGQFAKKIQAAGYKGEIISFEPILAVFRKLEARAQKYPAWKTIHSAVGAAVGEASIHVTANTVYSSIRKQSKLAAEFDAGTRVVTVENVKVVCLNEAIDNYNRRIFLKIDTQGFEKEVLTGADKLLEHCVGLQLEIPVEHLYDGVWSFREALEYLEALHFYPSQIWPVNSLGADPSSIIEFDCIFRRSTPGNSLA
jgi:FkbM family methyltransferase